MFFCFTFGSKTCIRNMQDYEDMRFQCQECHKAEAVAQKRWNWFTLCFIPLFPFYIKKTIFCPICKRTVKTSSEELDAIRHQGPALVGQQPQQQFMMK